MAARVLVEGDRLVRVASCQGHGHQVEGRVDRVVFFAVELPVRRQRLAGDPRYGVGRAEDIDDID